MTHFNKPEYDLIIENYLKGDWEAVLKAQSLLKEPYFLWPKPNKSDLDFIVDSLRKLGIESILSVGCGCGLLEWLLIASRGIKVIGVEIDKKYWKSKYARESFVDLIFPEDHNFPETIRNKNNALMFCYFNDRNAFHQYLDIYPGHCFIIIGPEDCGKYTDPGPFDESIPWEWQLWKLSEISSTKDFIAIYRLRK